MLLTVLLFTSSMMQGFSSLDLIFSILVQEIPFNCGSELPQARNFPNFFPQACLPANVSSSPLTCPSVGGQRQVDKVAVFTSPYPRRRKLGKSLGQSPATRALHQRGVRAPAGNRSRRSRALACGQRRLRAPPPPGGRRGGRGGAGEGGV